ncbi:MAG: HIT family protein [Actinomycetota bacterium]
MNREECPFCSEGTRSTAVAEKGSVYAVEDRTPVSPGHHLVIPFRHTPDFFTMTEREKREALELIDLLRERITATDPSVKAFNVGVNCGEEAGQTIMHAHIHLIPRRKGDTPDPRGGVRGVIPRKMGY